METPICQVQFQISQLFITGRVFCWRGLERFVSGQQAHEELGGAVPGVTALKVR